MFQPSLKWILGAAIIKEIVKDGRKYKRQVKRTIRGRSSQF